MDHSRFKHQPALHLHRVVSLLTCLLLLYAAAFSWQSWREEKAAKIEALMNLLELEEQAIGTYFQHLKNGLRVLSQDLVEVTDETNLDHAFSLVKRFKDLHPEFLNITFMREDGQILLTARTPPAPNLPTLANESSFMMFRETLQEAELLNIGRPLLSLINKEWIIPFRCPVKNHEGKLSHFVSANLPIRIMEDFWKEALFTKKSALGLMRDDGFLVSRYPVPTNIQMDEIYGKPRTCILINHLRQQHYPEKGYVEGPNSLDGPEFVNAFQRMEHYPITLFIAMPISEIRSAWWDKVIVPYTLSAILLLGGFFVYRMTLQRERTRELERWQASEELRDSQAFLNTIVEQSPISTWIADDKGTLIRANRALKDRLGVSDDEVVGKYNILEDNLIEEQGLMPLVRDVFEHGKTVRLTMEYDTSRVQKLALATFKQLILDVTISPIRDSNGRLTNAIIQHIDISELKEVEKALRVSEERLQESLLQQETILENSPFGISMVIDRKQVWVNREMEEMFQYPKGEMKGKATRDLFVCEDAHDRIGREAYLLLAQGKPYESVEELRRRDGSIMQVRCCGKAVDPSDMSKGTIWSLEDITENRKLKQQLQEAEEQYRRLIDNAPDILYRFASESGGVFYSQRVESILGYSVAELYERPMIWHDSIHPDDLPRVNEAISQLAKNQQFDLEYRIQAKDGQWHWFHDRAIGKVTEGDSIAIEGLASDITQQRNAEEALREAHSLLNSIIESLPEATLVIDTEGKVISWNKAIEEMTGITKSQMLHKGNYEYARPFYGERKPILVDMALKSTLGPSEEEYDRIEKDGEQYYGEIYASQTNQGKGAYLWGIASTLRDTSGKVRGAIETIRDISSRRQMQESLRQSEERYRIMFEKNRVIKLIIEPETGSIVDANPAACEFYGYSRDQMKSMRVMDLNTASPEEVKAEMELARVEKRDFFYFQHRLANGELRYVNVHSSPIEMDGRTLLFSIIQDVTDLKYVEDALKESEARFRLLVENAPDAIFVQTEGRFAYANPAALKLFGASCDEQLVGKPVLDVVHPSFHEIVVERIRLANIDKTPVPASELMFLSLDKEVLEVESLGMPISYENKDGALVFLRDVTERKRAEKERLQLEKRIHQAQKAESLGRMAGAIAHNFNNMLGAVIGNLDLAHDEVSDGSELQLCIREAMKASQRAATISRFMLTYLGQTAGKPESIDPAVVVREACSLLSPSLPKNVHLKGEIPSHGYATKADRAHLTQILTNLIENAVEAIGEKEGEIALNIDILPGAEIKERKLFPLDWEPRSEEYACISITDTGCGIELEQLDSIFDPFFSSKFAGRGLGLAVVLGLMRSANGAIGVESYLGRGTNFKLFFPLAERAKPVSIKEEAPIKEPVEESGLVLVVDDEDTVRNMAEAMLKRKLGYVVLAARDGFDALRIFKERKDEIDLVLLDLSMPGMNGWETLAALRGLRPDIPVILSSGYDEAQVNRGEHLELPQAFLHKPYGTKELKAALAEAQGSCPRAGSLEG